jgi:outer membrane protein OmpA-like peptidoglycan-associated protein
VTSPAGSVELTTARGSTRVAPGAVPTPQAEMTEEEIQRIFGDALAARPPAPRQFLLYFLAGGDELTAESRALLPQIVEFVRGRATADVTVIGHTDTTDTAQANVALGLRRATLIRNQLLAVGLSESQVDVSSHGKTDLLVPTADNVPQPRNRRVEVTVR